ncbi:Methyltransferase domain-containing protein [Limimonas halophila]|uniref:Methyltransferase domain-containing protein n=1 Tax=Limimonas halophila TaxID=1082479 RepID=A0A1G7L5J0_9PROT|nr:class I SAM-dependent methyltransferase [Limimonas halophila]SDF44733.1 Methyltransferase domain-containing protein [Limimonas halophila]
MSWTAWLERGRAGSRRGIGPGRGDGALPPRDLRTSTDVRDVGRPGPDTRELFARALGLPGAFNLDDCGHFQLVLTLQRLSGLTGDLLEIGTHGGRSAAIMAACLGPGETLVCCDPFDLPDAQGNASKRTPDRVLANIRAAVPDLPNAAVRFHRCFSEDLALAPGDRFRFAHVDGDHSEARTHADLVLCREHLLPGGVVVLDDHGHPAYPGVEAAARRFLDTHPDMRVLAELNRHGAAGRKLYLYRAMAVGGLDAAPSDG